MDEVVGSFSAGGDGHGPYPTGTVSSSRWAASTNPAHIQQPGELDPSDRGEIVGWSDLHAAAGQTSVPRAFVYRSGQMANLMAELDPADAAGQTAVLTNAVAINCDGWIVANGVDAVTGANHAYLLKPEQQPPRIEGADPEAWQGFSQDLKLGLRRVSSLGIPIPPLKCRPLIPTS